MPGYAKIRIDKRAVPPLWSAARSWVKLSQLHPNRHFCVVGPTEVPDARPRFAVLGLLLQEGAEDLGESLWFFQEG